MSDKNQNTNAAPEPDHQLDAALEKWNRATSSDPQAVERAKEKTLRAIGALAEESQADFDASIVTPVGRESQWSMTRLTALAAAVLVAAFCVTQFMNPSSSSEIDGINEKTLSFVSLDAEQQNEKLAHFSALFGHELGSVAEFDDEVQIELSETVASDLTPRSENFLAIKLVLVSRPTLSNSDSWKVEHRIQVLARPQRRVDIRAGSNSCSLWAMPVDNDLISIDLNFELSGKRSVAFNSNALQRSLDPREIHSTTVGATEYRLYQTGTRLDSIDADSASLQRIELLCFDGRQAE
jgi:hypothetical protein